jgi:hypothetical protein
MKTKSSEYQDRAAKARTKAAKASERSNDHQKGSSS